MTNADVGTKDNFLFLFIYLFIYLFSLVVVVVIFSVLGFFFLFFLVSCFAFVVAFPVPQRLCKSLEFWPRQLVEHPEQSLASCFSRVWKTVVISTMGTLELYLQS